MENFKILDSNGIELQCPCGSTDVNCMPITWPKNDLYLNQCMNFTRSSATFPNFNCQYSK
jgi:hypothetical protein